MSDFFNGKKIGLWLQVKVVGWQRVLDWGRWWIFKVKAKMATYNCKRWSWVYVTTTNVFRTMVTVSVDSHFKARCVAVQDAWLKGRLLNPVTKSISPAKMELSGLYPDQLVIRSKMPSNCNDSLIGKIFYFLFLGQDKRDGQRWACHGSGHSYDL